jgi:carboxymethylenebutenolidase
MSDITIAALDGGSFSAYVALPVNISAQNPAPCVVLIQEIFGVNAEMRQKCDDYATAGYIAVCPDLFWRLEPGVQLTDKTKAEWEKAFDLMNRLDQDKAIEDIRAAVHVFRGHAHATGAVGCVGYCLGGRLAFLTAARTKIDCAVSYYGVGLDNLLGEAANITGPVLLHIAEQDKFVPPAAREKIIDGLTANPHVTINTYPGADHAFARIGGEHYNEGCADLANKRTMNFLESSLHQAGGKSSTKKANTAV